MERIYDEPIELSMEQLDMVAGGGCCAPPPPPHCAPPPPPCGGGPVVAIGIGVAVGIIL